MITSGNLSVSFSTRKQLLVGVIVSPENAKRRKEKWKELSLALSEITLAKSTACKWILKGKVVQYVRL